MRIDYQGGPALLLNLIEMGPRAAAVPLPSRARPTAWETLDSLGEGVITTDVSARHRLREPGRRAADRRQRRRCDRQEHHRHHHAARRGRSPLARRSSAALPGDAVEGDGRAARSDDLARRRRGALGRAHGDAAALAEGRPDRHGHRGPRRQRAARYHAPDVVPGEPRRAHRPGQPTRVRAPPRRSARDGALQRSAPRAVLSRPRPLQGRQRQLRPHGGRRHAARGRRAHQGNGPRLRYRRTPRRRRVRSAAGRLPAGESAADLRRRGQQGQRLSLRLEGQDLQHRRERRAARDLARERRAGRSIERRRLGLLRGEAPGQPRARVLGARRSRGAPSRRDPVAAATAVGAQGKPLRADGADDRRDVAR